MIRNQYAAELPGVEAQQLLDATTIRQQPACRFHHATMACLPYFEQIACGCQALLGVDRITIIRVPSVPE
jgi:hypothetical protein